MKTQDLNDWLQLVAAVAVIGGLILVAAELRQNQDLARAQLNSDSLAALEQMALSRQNEPLARALAKSYETPEEVTVYEALIIDGYYRQLFDMLVRENAFVQRGIYDDQRQILARIVAGNILSSEFGRIWWDMSKPGLSSSLTAMVDEQAAEMQIPEMRDVIAIYRQRLAQPISK